MKEEAAVGSATFAASRPTASGIEAATDPVMDVFAPPPGNGSGTQPQTAAATDSTTTTTTFTTTTTTTTTATTSSSSIPSISSSMSKSSSTTEKSVRDLKAEIARLSSQLEREVCVFFSFFFLL